MSCFVYCHDRAERGMTQPIIRRLKAAKLWEGNWRKARIVIIPGDRREAMRFALDVFEAGKAIWHLGSQDQCPGDFYHYDGTYRGFITVLAERCAGGLALKLHGDAESSFTRCVGPVMQDDIGPVNPSPCNVPFNLLCYNVTPFAEEEIPMNQSDILGLAAHPGNDGDAAKLNRQIEANGWRVLPRMPRNRFLRYVANAERVIGNSSLLCFEAPLFHADSEIVFVGKRNLGRKIVRWDREKHGSPSDNLVRLVKEALT